MITIPMTVSASNAYVPMTISGTDTTIPMVLSVECELGRPPQYTGPTEFAPSQDYQTIDTHDKMMVEDIIIDPIPQNYGLITWNGSTITVS